MLDLAIIIVSFNTCELTKKCIKSIFQSDSKLKFKIYLVDNHSSDQTISQIQQNFPQVEVIKSSQNLGFTGGNNLALKKIEAEYVLLLNSDTEIQTGCLDVLVKFAKSKNFAISSCKILGFDKIWQPNAGELPTWGPVFYWLSGLDGVLGLSKSYQARDKKYYQNGKEVGWVSGTVMLIKQEVFKKIGFLDEKIFMYGEDVEFCLRAQRAGFKIGWTDGTEVFHLGGGSLAVPHFTQWLGEFRGLLYIYRKYYGLVQSWGLRFSFYLFIMARIVVFALLGQFANSLTYGKILVSI